MLKSIYLIAPIQKPKTYWKTAYLSQGGGV